MIRITQSLGGVAAIAVVAATLAACNPQADKTNPPATATAASPAASDRNVRLLAAAEGYETLTETAFDKTFPELAASLTVARQTTSEARTLLAPDQAARLDTLGAGIDTAMRDQNRSALAIAAVETYRVLVSAQDASAQVPVEVSLLDYAGFRYDANAKSKPINWGRMTADVVFARETWTRISPRVTAKGLSGAFDSALSGMETAVAQKNAVAAGIAVSNELALVDALEEHFKPAN
ncbi:MAG: hypothetical protein A2792_09385 [Sphingomonadales bacterium RIFCSPHIGHO2_01_FULL_65_20]|jgi:hypothetical protein|nr:MAG: hypothetical protein A2792_09385 [Sphingomonadales bacterium RIFCSPHIGHO2_01_FULL_65_20]